MLGTPRTARLGIMVFRRVRCLPPSTGRYHSKPWKMVLFSGHGREGGTKSGFGRRALDASSFDEDDDGCYCCLS